LDEKAGMKEYGSPRGRKIRRKDSVVEGRLKDKQGKSGSKWGGGRS